MKYNELDVISSFKLPSKCVKAELFGNGHIHDTWLVKCDNGDKFVMQCINKEVFKKPDEVMENMLLITEHLRRKVLDEGGEPDREVINLCKTFNDKAYYLSPEGEFFRMYNYIGGAKTYNTVENPLHFYNAAKAFGRFQKRLNDFSVDSLLYTIPDFHNTKKRYSNLMKAVAEDKFGRAAEVAKEIEFAKSREADVNVIVALMEQGRIPLRVTHNDTKFNNVLIDDKTHEGICVLDLDTVMPGSLLYDYGDSLRFGANKAMEDETDLSKVDFDFSLFETFTSGFLSELKDYLAPAEAENLGFSIKLMTLECGMRFLTDHLSGDVYFKIKRPNHNLDRCRTQFKFVEVIEENLDKINRYISSL